MKSEGGIRVEGDGEGEMVNRREICDSGWGMSVRGMGKVQGDWAGGR